MAELHLDQNVPGQVARLLQQSGHTVVTARGLGMYHASDPEHLLAAATQGRVLITRDNDFLDLHLAWQLWATAWQMRPAPTHGGIIIASSNRAAPDAVRAVDALLQGGTQLKNRLWRDEPPRGWVPY